MTGTLAETRELGRVKGRAEIMFTLTELHIEKETSLVKTNRITIRGEKKGSPSN